MSDTLTSHQASRLWARIPQRREANRASFERVPIQREIILTFLALDWFNAVKQFREIEADVLDRCEFEESTDDHKAATSQLIADGEHLCLGIKQRGLVKGAEFRLEDVKAIVESLRDTFRGIHGPHNHPETNRRLDELESQVPA